MKRAPTGFSGVPRTRADVARALSEVEAAIERKERNLSLQEEAAELSQDLGKFIRRAWAVVEPRETYRHNWHIDAIVEHLEAVSRGEIRRLQVWIPPQSMKSRAVSIFWPAWEWTTRPNLRYFTASYDLNLSREMSLRSRDLIQDPWYQERWGDVFRMRKVDVTYLTNNKGGTRLATSPTSTGTGKHGHRLIIDDAVNANAVNDTALNVANSWYSGALATRGLGKMYAEVIIQQRLHEKDLAAYALGYGEWTVLCLPEEYEPAHPFAWRRDPRKTEGELLWPTVIDETEHKMRLQKLGRHQAAGQLQQRPAAREGEIIKRNGWNYYPPDALADIENGNVRALPKFRRIVITWDTSYKEKSTSDYVAGGVWGVYGANRYLLRIYHQRASLSKTKTLMTEARAWALRRWPRTPIHLVIEKASNGIEIIEQLQKEIPGVVAYTSTKDKIERAEACEPDFDAGNVYVCGAPKASMEDYDPNMTPDDVQGVIEECAAFPNGAHDDRVDMVTMALNFARSKGSGRGRLSSPAGTVVDIRRRIAGATSDRVPTLTGR